MTVLPENLAPETLKYKPILLLHEKDFPGRECSLAIGLCPLTDYAYVSYLHQPMALQVQFLVTDAISLLAPII
jgi:hypothetical protein